MKDWSPLGNLRGLHVVVLLHVLVECHHILLAFSSVGLPTSHRCHQAVSIIREVELVSIWRDVHIVVHASVQGAHLVDTRVKVHIVTCSKGAVG